MVSARRERPNRRKRLSRCKRPSEMGKHGLRLIRGAQNHGRALMDGMRLIRLLLEYARLQGHDAQGIAT